MLKRHEIEILLKAGHSKAEVARLVANSSLCHLFPSSHHNSPDCFAYWFRSDLPQIAQAMAMIQQTMVNENRQGRR